MPTPMQAHRAKNLVAEADKSTQTGRAVAAIQAALTNAR